MVWKKGLYRRGFYRACCRLSCGCAGAIQRKLHRLAEVTQFLRGLFREGRGTKYWRTGMPKPELPEGPQQIVGKAGDVVLTHHQIVSHRGTERCG